MAHKKVLTKQIVAKVKRYRLLVEQSGIKVSALYVFGSQVKGTATQSSDLDIGVVSPNFGQDRLEERAHLLVLGSKIDSMIEPHPFSPDEFNDRYYPLAHEIKQTGIKVM